MISKKCLRCGKVIEGYTQSHVDYLMKQHELKHQREDEEKNK